MEDKRRTQPIESTKQDSHELTETEATSKGLQGSVPHPLYVLQLLVWCFGGTPNNGN